MKITNFAIIVLVVVIGFLLFRSVKVEDADKKTLGDASQITASPSKEGKMPEIKTGNLTIEKKLLTISTSKGDIEVELYLQAAPKTVENFLKKAGEGFYNNKTWHRVEDWVVQGGDPKGDGTGGGDMPTELNDLTFSLGSIGIARGPDININNDSQFFIVKKDSSFLDKQYTNFGKVTVGMDVVNNISIGDKILNITTK